jgi:hypothetical protein
LALSRELVDALLCLLVIADQDGINAGSRDR